MKWDNVRPLPRDSDLGEAVLQFYLSLPEVRAVICERCGRIFNWFENKAETCERCTKQTKH